MIQKYGIIGILLVILSYFLNYTQIIPERYFALIIPHYFFIIGLFLFFDALDFKLNKTSLIHRMKNKNHLMLRLVLVGSVIGIVFEIYGVYISNLWYSYFQNWPLLKSLPPYFLGILVGYGLPALMYFSAYKVVSTLIKKKYHKHKLKIPKGIFTILLIIGIIFLIIPIIFYKQSLEWNPIVRGSLFGFCLIGLWLIFEYFEHKQHKHTFLTTLFQTNFKPLLSMIIMSLIISISWEYLNVLRASWIYQNIPFINITILGLPIAIIIAWPMLFVVYFSAYRIIFKDKERIW